MVNRFYADSSVKSARVSLFLSVYKSLLPVCDNESILTKTCTASGNLSVSQSLNLQRSAQKTPRRAHPFASSAPCETP